jgi:anthraniloyl-CoA monooxygenase
MNPYFTLHAAAQYGVTLLRSPPQYEPGQSQLCRLMQQAQAEMTELRLKTKPKAHDPGLLKAAE